VGDAGPATKPTDKTDITPYTNHIYTSKPRNRRKGTSEAAAGHNDDDEQQPHRHMPPTRRETEEESVLEYLLELAKKEAERQIQETALAAFPNSGAREGGAVHFYFDEDSSSDKNVEGVATPEQHKSTARVRRKSSAQDLPWWQQHMQEHAQQLARHRGEDVAEADEDVVMEESDSELDRMDISAPPDPLWTTTTTKKISADERRDSMAEALPPLLHRDAGPTTSSPDYRSSHHQHTHIHDSQPISAARRDSELSARRGSPAQQASAGTPHGSPFAKPFGGFGWRAHDPKQRKTQHIVSPPMLGKDLTFRTCPSPKHTKLVPNHPFAQQPTGDRNRDVTGQSGLWRGYCYRSDSGSEYLVPAATNQPAMMHTPLPPATPIDFDESGFETAIGFNFPSMLDPNGINNNSATGTAPGASARGQSGSPSPRGPAAALFNLDERLRKEKAQSERDDKIAQEFNDAFVTQVYNYLSLGYPATAGGFDDELARISRTSVAELRLDDEKQMAKGHMLEEAPEQVPHDKRCPRWNALRLYVTEWARQHPDLDNLDPLAWGVRERRGSWAI
jgi:hypothetical protein